MHIVDVTTTSSRRTEAKPVLRCFEPRMGWSKEQNEGRTCTLSPID